MNTNPSPIGEPLGSSGLTQLLVDRGAIGLNPPNSEDRILYRAFGDVGLHFDDHYAVYRYLYSDTPILKSSITLNNYDAFAYCQRRRYFVLICPYTDRRELLVERTFTDTELSWTLCGGSVRRDLAESFVDAAGRHAQKSIQGLEIGEVEPVAFFENTFKFDDQVHVHLGIGFVGRVRNTDLAARLRSVVGSRAHLIDSNNPLPPFSLTHNKAMAESAATYVKALDASSSPEIEVAENLRYRRRYEFHDRFVKPLFYKAGNHLFEHSLDDLNSQIHQGVTKYANNGAFLDVACGDNSLVLDLAKSEAFSLLVGNDVSWSQVQLLSSRKKVADLRDRSAFTLFTNHDARHLPFPSAKFDVGFCKNVLHHMDSLQSVRALLDELIRVSKTAIVVEVMDPAMESPWGRFRHRYYMDFLKDAGEHFLSRREFAELTDDPTRVTLNEMRTIRGVYQFAIFRKEENNAGD
jgi:ubiquinone/menaquinone biosynthesis C-methylase UbiE